MIEIKREVKQVTITATRDGKTVVLQPVISRSGDGFDGVVDGGTL